ncbi:MAG: DUF4271 domain-containing protein [Bacteroidales bacterium]|nr:DUF4271 domain-containing protein [Bacteroidales bacterium]
MVTQVIISISILAVMLLLRNLVSVFPSLVACVIRTKEIINLEASVKLSRNRDIIAVVMVPVFCLLASKYSLYDISLLEGKSPDARLGLTSAIFILYILFRTAISKILKPQRIPQKTYNTVENASRTFFSVLSLLLLACAGVFSVIGADLMVTRSAMLWISAIIYFIFIIRKTEIFFSCCSVFTAFLYLCALEIIPTGTLVVSAIIFS